MSSIHPINDPPMGEQPYVIRLTGELGGHWQAWFEGMTVEQPGDGTTVITGRITDQAALHGVLQRIRDLGMPLVSVTRVSADERATDQPSSNSPNTKGNQP